MIARGYWWRRPTGDEILVASEKDGWGGRVGKVGDEKKFKVVTQHSRNRDRTTRFESLQSEFYHHQTMGIFLF